MAKAPWAILLFWVTGVHLLALGDPMTKPWRAGQNASDCAVDMCRLRPLLIVYSPGL